MYKHHPGCSQNEMTNIEIKQFCLDGDRNTLKMFRRNSEHLDQVVQNDLLDKFVCSEVVHRPNALYHDEFCAVSLGTDTILHGDQIWPP